MSGIFAPGDVHERTGKYLVHAIKDPFRWGIWWGILEIKEKGLDETI
jgi:hypothetical protein